MPFIICDTSFKDGRDAYHSGERRLVDDEKAAYFVDNKWAHRDGDDPAPSAGQMAEVQIQSHDVVHVTQG